MGNRFRPFFAAVRQRGPGRRWVLLGLVLLLLTLLGVLLMHLGGAAHQMRLAERDLAKHDYAAARSHLALYLEVWPGDARGHFRAARAARHCHLYDEAAEHLRVCRLNGWDEDALTVEKQLTDLQRGDARAVSPLQARLESDNPNAPAILEVLIQYYIDSYRLFSARDALDRYLHYYPDDVKALLGRGFVAERLFDFADAAIHYRRAVESQPANGPARLHLAQSLERSGDPQEALALFQELRGADVNQSDVMTGLARCHRLLAHFDEAERILDEQLAEHPDDPAALRERGIIDLDRDRVVEAEPWLRRAVAADPYDRQACHNLYLCLRRLDKKAEAEEVRVRLDRLADDMKRLDHLLTHEVQRAPNNPALRCEAGSIFLRNGQEQEGLRWLGLALQCDPQDGPTHQAFADYYRSKGQTERAAYHRRLANLAPLPLVAPGVTKEP